MSKFDAILKKIEEQVPPLAPQQQQQKPAGAQQFDQKLVQDLVAAKDPQTVTTLLQKFAQTQQKPATQQPQTNQQQPATNQQQPITNQQPAV